jgi:hypothetical protein
LEGWSVFLFVFVIPFAFWGLGRSFFAGVMGNCEGNGYILLRLNLSIAVCGFLRLQSIMFEFFVERIC